MQLDDRGVGLVALGKTAAEIDDMFIAAATL